MCLRHVGCRGEERRCRGKKGTPSGVCGSGPWSKAWPWTIDGTGRRVASSSSAFSSGGGVQDVGGMGRGYLGLTADSAPLLVTQRRREHALQQEKIPKKFCVFSQYDGLCIDLENIDLEKYVKRNEII